MADQVRKVAMKISRSVRIGVEVKDYLGLRRKTKKTFSYRQQCWVRDFLHDNWRIQRTPYFSTYPPGHVNYVSIPDTNRIIVDSKKTIRSIIVKPFIFRKKYNASTI